MFITPHRKHPYGNLCPIMKHNFSCAKTIKRLQGAGIVVANKN